MMTSKQHSREVSGDSSSSSSSTLEEATHSPQQEGMKRVTFNPMVQCRSIMPRSGYSEEEAHRSWLSDDEMEKMTERRSKTVERMESGKNSRRESTYRGLESLSHKGEAALVGFIRECVDAVLDEQDRQYYLEVQDHEMIALASSQSSEECAAIALKRGRSDAREAKRCYHHHHRSSRSRSEESNSSVSVSDEHRNFVPILKTGGGICESPADATLQTAPLDVVVG